VHLVGFIVRTLKISMILLRIPLSIVVLSD